MIHLLFILIALLFVIVIALTDSHTEWDIFLFIGVWAVLFGIMELIYWIRWISIDLNLI